MTASLAMQEVCLAAPEQFFTVECLLRSAANAKHVAERAEAWDIAPEVAEALHRAALAGHDAAGTLLESLCPTYEVFRGVFAELTRMVAV